MVLRARGNACVCHSSLRIYPEPNYFPPPPLGVHVLVLMCAICPPLPSGLFSTRDSTVIPLTSKSYHTTCLYKATNGSHLTRSRGQGHHSGPRPHKINLRTCHSLSLLFFPISLPLTTLPSCCSPNMSATFLPQDLCTCSVPYWNICPSPRYLHGSFSHSLQVFTQMSPSL